MVSTRCTSYERQFGRRWHARRTWHCRGKPGRAPQYAQVYRGTLHRRGEGGGGGAGIKFGEGIGQLYRQQAKGVLNPSRVRTGGFLRRKIIHDHGVFSCYESQQGAKYGQDSRGVFQGCTGLWTAGCRLARQLHRLKASTAMDLGNTSTFFLLSA